MANKHLIASLCHMLLLATCSSDIIDSPSGYQRLFIIHVACGKLLVASSITPLIMEPPFLPLLIILPQLIACLFLRKPLLLTHFGQLFLAKSALIKWQINMQSLPETVFQRQSPRRVSSVSSLPPSPKCIIYELQLFSLSGCLFFYHKKKEKINIKLLEDTGRGAKNSSS